MKKDEAKKEVATAPAGPSGSKKLVIAVIGIAVVMVVVGIIAAATGLFSGSATKNGTKGGSEDISKNAALGSKEYKAVQEYNQYLDGLTDKELDKLIDTSDEAIYDAPDKVKELCEKYGLKYAKKKTAITSYEQFEKALAEKKISGIFSEELDTALQSTIKDYDGGYIFDDGNFYLEIEQEETGNKKDSVVFTTINISPKGVFPGNVTALESKTNDEEVGSKSTTFNCKVNGGDEFACIVDESEGWAFGQAGDYFVSIDISRDLTEKETETMEKALEEINAKVKKETGLENLEALEEKVSAGLEEAWEKEPEAMQEALENDDTSQYEALRKKYSKASEKEIALFEECSKEAATYEDAIAITKADMEKYLDKIDFSKFV